MFTTPFTLLIAAALAGPTAAVADTPSETTAQSAADRTADDTSELGVYDDTLWYLPGPMAVQLASNEFEAWGDTIELNSAGTETFEWAPADADLFWGTAAWQLTTTEQDHLDSGENRTLLATGAVALPSSGEVEQFSVDLAGVLPDAPPNDGADYFMRVVATDESGAAIAGLTESVELFYKPVTAVHIDLSFDTVAEHNPEMMANDPMSVAIDLETLYVNDDNESADEPYLMYWVVLVDGTTINPLLMSSATVRILTPPSLHGNVPDHDKYGEDLDDNHTAIVPWSTGHHETTIAPIGLPLVANMQEQDNDIGPAIMSGTRIYLLAVAMEEDASDTDDVEAGFEAATDSLQAQLDAVLQGITLSDLQSGSVDFDPQAIQDAVMEDAMSAAEDSFMDGPWFLPPVFPTLIGEIVDPDDYVGWDLFEVSYGQLLNAGSGGVDFSLEMLNHDDWEGWYTLNGTIRMD